MLASQNAEASFLFLEEHWADHKISLSKMRRILGERAFRIELPLKEQFLQNERCYHLLSPLFSSNPFDFLSRKTKIAIASI